MTVDTINYLGSNNFKHMTHPVTQRYTQAIFNLSREADELDAVHRDLQQIDKLIDASEELAAFLLNPVIPSQTRQEILESIFKGKIEALTFRFILFLESKKRLYCLKDICKVFEKLYLDLKGIVKVKIETGIALNKDQVNEVCKHLKSRLNADIEPHFKVEPTMLGGIKLRKGDQVYDCSLRMQLEQFRKQIIEA